MGQNQVSLIERCPLFGGPFSEVSLYYFQWVYLMYILNASESLESSWDQFSHVPAVLLHCGAGLGAQHQVCHLYSLSHQHYDELVGVCIANCISARFNSCIVGLQLHYAEVSNYRLQVSKSQWAPLIMRESSDVSLFQMVKMHTRNCSCGGRKGVLTRKASWFWGVLSVWRREWT